MRHPDSHRAFPLLSAVAFDKVCEFLLVGGTLSVRSATYVVEAKSRINLEALSLYVLQFFKNIESMQELTNKPKNKNKKEHGGKK